MAALSEGIVAWVKTLSAVTALIGMDDDCRFYPDAVQESPDLPYVVYDEDKDSPYQTQGEVPTVASSEVTFSCVGADTSEASAVADALGAELEGMYVDGGTMGAVTVQRVVAGGVSSAYQFDEQAFAVDLKAKVWYAR